MQTVFVDQMRAIGTWWDLEFFVAVHAVVLRVVEVRPATYSVNIRYSPISTLLHVQHRHAYR